MSDHELPGIEILLEKTFNDAADSNFTGRAILFRQKDYQGIRVALELKSTGTFYPVGDGYSGLCGGSRELVLNHEGLGKLKYIWNDTVPAIVAKVLPLFKLYNNWASASDTDSTPLVQTPQPQTQG